MGLYEVSGHIMPFFTLQEVFNKLLHLKVVNSGALFWMRKEPCVSRASILAGRRLTVRLSCRLSGPISGGGGLGGVVREGRIPGVHPLVLPLTTDSQKEHGNFTPCWHLVQNGAKNLYTGFWPKWHDLIPWRHANKKRSVYCGVKLLKRVAATRDYIKSPACISNTIQVGECGSASTTARHKFQSNAPLMSGFSEAAPKSYRKEAIFLSSSQISTKPWFS